MNGTGGGQSTVNMFNELRGKLGRLCDRKTMDSIEAAAGVWPV